MAPTRLANENITISPEPLEQSTFAPFGSVIISPLPPSQNTLPEKISATPNYHSLPSKPIVANQSTALKYAPIAATSNNYPDAPSKHIGQPLQSLFACFPRTLREGRFLDAQLLERHPYTTQTFSPLGLDSNSETFYLVVVAPSLQVPTIAKSDLGKAVQISHPPDLGKLRAFVAHGAQAVTYGEGTWHAPMIVIGKKRVDFLVTQFVSGVPDEDCQEVLLSRKFSVLVHQHDRSPLRSARPNL